MSVPVPEAARARIHGVIVDTSRRVQSLYVPVGDGVRLAVDVWLPAERTAVGGTVGTVMRVTRYHRAEAPQEPGPEADTNAAAGDLFNRAGFALVVVDARGTGASFGTRTAIGEHQSNTDVHALMGRVPFRDDRVAGLDWEATAPAASGPAVASSGVPMLVRAGWLDGGFAAGALARFVTQASHQQVEIGPWGHGGGSFVDTLRPSGAAEHDPLSPGSQDRRLVDFFARYLERNGKPQGPSTLRFGTLGTGAWETVTSWPPAGIGTQRWYLGSMAGLTREAGPAGTVTHRVDVTASTGATNRWLAIDLGRAPAYPGRRHADDSLLTFTSGPLPADVHVLGFPVVTMRLATSGTDGAVYVYLEDVDPDGDVSYLTEGCLRFPHRKTSGPAEPVRLGVPRTFARPDALRVVPGNPMGLTVQLLPVSAVVPAGHRVRVAIAGHDASSFTRYGPAEETFTLRLGSDSRLDLPVRYG
jgi:uncharacterized protein